MNKALQRWSGSGVLPAVLAGMWILTAPVQDARAATATTVMSVTATVLSLCTIVATPLVFGNYTAVTLDAAATISVVCTLTTSYDVGLDQGTGSGATVSSREMTSGAALLNYSLFRDAAHTSNWGQTVGSDTMSGVGTGLPQILTVYGRVPAGQFINPGVYLDVITATITY